MEEVNLLQTDFVQHLFLLQKTPHLNFFFVAQVQVPSMCPELLINPFIQNLSWCIGKSWHGILLHILSGGFQIYFQIHPFLIIAEVLARIKLYLIWIVHLCIWKHKCSPFPVCLPSSVFAFVPSQVFMCTLHHYSSSNKISVLFFSLASQFSLIMQFPPAVPKYYCRGQKCANQHWDLNFPELTEQRLEESKALTIESIVSVSVSGVEISFKKLTPPPKQQNYYFPPLDLCRKFWKHEIVVIQESFSTYSERTKHLEILSWYWALSLPERPFLSKSLKPKYHSPSASTF